MKKLDYNVYLDKVLACWTGKSLGGIIGAPYECHKQFKNADINNLWPKILYPNDDLDIQVVYLEALQEHGLFIDSEFLAKYWKEHCFYVCCEYGIFINSVDHKIMPPYSGEWNNNFHRSSMGCPIRSELWGILCAGNPALAAEYASIDGCLDHGSLSIEIEQFLSAAASLSFFHNDLRDILEQSLGYIPADSKVREIYRSVIEICAEEKEIYRAWKKVIRLWGNRNATSAITNFALTLMALFMCDNDFRKAMHVCVQCGWDADCTAATVGALLGLINGTAILPKEWCDKMGKTLVCACEIPHQFATLETFAKETCELGVEMSKLRNTELELTGAPDVKVRPQVVPPFKIKAHYPGDPLLCYHTPTMVELRITSTAEFNGTVSVSAPELVIAEYDSQVRIKAGETAVVPVKITCDRSMEWMKSKNFFTVQLLDNGRTVAEYEFGLQGANEYQVYGPYWDMWDMEKHKVCPYDCEELTCNPGNIPGLRDAMDMYVQFHKEYLDETALLDHDLPDEMPFAVEKGNRAMTSEDLGNFVGTCCYYFVKTFRYEQEIAEPRFTAGTNATMKAWLDGKFAAEQTVPMPCMGKAVDVSSGKPGIEHRAVIKLVVRADQLQMTDGLHQAVNSRTQALSPYVNDVSFKVVK